MASIEDPSVGEWFSGTMETIRNTLLVPSSDMIEMGMELYQTHRQFITTAVETSSKKCTDDEMLFETIQTYTKDLEQKKVALKERKSAVSKKMTEIEQKEAQKADLFQNIGRLQEDQVKRRELILSQHKANKNRLKNLQKAKQVFQDHLGLEIRHVPGQHLQFIFRNIDPANQDNAYIFTLAIKEDGMYHIVSSDPVIQSMPELEKKLQETNNFSAFLANVRKEFVSQARY